MNRVELHYVTVALTLEANSCGDRAIKYSLRFNCHGDYRARDHDGRAPPTDGSREMNSNEENSRARRRELSFEQIDPT